MELLSTSKAAQLIGAGTTSVKRWADTGSLDCVRTPGGHRRFTRDALDRFVRLQHGETAVNEETGRSVDTLLSEMGPELVLWRAHRRLGSWSRVAAEFAPVLAELGRRWAKGEITVDQEHMFSERLLRTLARITESIPLPQNAPTCLLACVESEGHTLGLSLAELCFRESGWASLWLGAHTPTDAIIHQVRQDERIGLVGLSASEHSDAFFLRRVDSAVGAVCHEQGIMLVLGGGGPWPEEPTFGQRFQRFDQVDAPWRPADRANR